MLKKVHQPVLPVETAEYIALKKGGVYVDMTVGGGGHSYEFLSQMEGEIEIIGLDRDTSILEFADQRLSPFSGSYSLHHASFSNIDMVLEQLEIDQVDGFLMDIGVSSLQLDQADRGFSLQKEGPLDMRMDKTQELTAEYVVNRYTETELADVIYHYGEERKSRQIASAIVQYRQRKKILSTLELANIVTSTLRYRGKIHPATRTFQALRIEVNHELEELQHTLQILPEFLSMDGRAVVISFHSLEDRIVKNAFKNKDLWQAITKKPVMATEQEVKTNKRSRSAKLRCATTIKNCI